MAGMMQAFRVINEMVEAGIIRSYAIAGAVAALNYIEPTVTEDLDVLISVESLGNQSGGIITLGPIISYLAERGYTEFKKEGIVVEGWPVQFLPVANALDGEGLAEAREVEIPGLVGSARSKVRVLSPEHLVATALKVGRPKDRERILRFVEANVLDWAKLRGLLERHDLLVRWDRLRIQLGLPDFDERT